ncbi:MAG: hypothetical protein RIS52_1674, partial [Pseudomonadota bacterium]
MPTIQMIIMGGGVFLTLVMLIIALSGPSQSKEGARRLNSIKDRSLDNGGVAEATMRRAIASRPNKKIVGGTNLVPNRAALEKRLERTGKSWTVKQYVLASVGLLVFVVIGFTLKSFPLKLGLIVGVFVALFVPHMVVSKAIKKRLTKFNDRFPDGIELM